MNTFKEKLWYYFKDTAMTYSYILVAGMIGYIILFMAGEGDFNGFVCSLLSFLNIALYLFVARNIFLKTGE